MGPCRDAVLTDVRLGHTQSVPTPLPVLHVVLTKELAVRPSEFVPWEGELLQGSYTWPDCPPTPQGLPSLPACRSAREPSDTPGWDGHWIDLGGEG